MNEQLDQALSKLVEEAAKSINITNGNIENAISSIKKMMPDLYENVAGVIFYDCLGDILVSMMFFVIAILGICHVARLSKKINEPEYVITGNEDIFVSFGFIGFSAMLAVSSVFVLNIWNWIGLFNQKAWLIHEVGIRLLYL